MQILILTVANFNLGLKIPSNFISTGILLHAKMLIHMCMLVYANPILFKH